jgi:hypothetical protein
LIMKWKHWMGLVACVALISASFMHWTFYPDIQKYFTGFFTEKNYYGRPGIFLSFFAGIGILSYLTRKVWLTRINLIAGGLCMGYAIKSFLLFVSSYDGYVPERQAGIYIMIVAAFVNMVAAMTTVSTPKLAAPAAKP